MRRHRESAAEAMSRRVQSLATQWRPVPRPRPGDDGDESGASDEGPRGLDALTPIAEPDDPWRRAVQRDEARWSRPAVRALVVVIGACLAVAAWWWWSGRPRDVIASAPAVVIATGGPVSGLPPARATSAPAGPVAVTSAPQAVPVAMAPSLAPSSVAPPMTAHSEPAAPDLVVHVSGDVVHPGIVRLAPGSRVADAVAAAGGVTRRRAADSVNLARPVIDGEQIVVDADVPAASRPPQGGSPPGGASGSTGAPERSGTPGAPLGGTVGAPLVLDLNVADAAALEALPGVGPVLAGRIVQWRLDNGSFTSVDELGEISGIGDAILGRLRPLVRV